MINDVTASANKYTAVRKLAEVRGIKEFSTLQKGAIIELCEIDLSPREILDEVMNAPKERAARAVKSTRKLLSSTLNKLSKAIAE